MATQQVQHELTTHNVFTALCILSGYDQDKNGSPSMAPSHIMIKEAETALLFWEDTNPRAYTSSLLEIIFLHESKIDQFQQSMIPRLASLLSLKAMVTRKWKDRGRGHLKQKKVLLDEETKNHIRSTVLTIVTNGYSGEDTVEKPLSHVIINEKSLQSTASSVLSKIGRQELPLKSLDIIPTLVGYATGTQNQQSTTYSNDNDQIRVNASNALEGILDELCSKRLLVDKKYIVSIAQTHLFVLVTNGLCMAMDRIKQVCLGTVSGKGDLTLDYTISMSKIIHHLIESSLPSLVEGSRKGSENMRWQDAQGGVQQSAGTVGNTIDQVFAIALEYIPLLMTHVQNQASAKNQASITDPEEGFLEPLLLELLEMVVNTQKKHPIAFVRFLVPFLNVVYNHLVNCTVSTLKPVDSNGDSISILQITFFASVISCPEYEPRVHTDDTINQVLQLLWNDFFQMEKINNLTDIALFFMAFSETSHLLDWSTDPESFYVARYNASSEVDIMACGQNLYLALVESKASQEFVVSKIISTLEDVNGQMVAAQNEAGIGIRNENCNYVSDKNVLQWDGIYTAVGLSLSTIENRVSFNLKAWFESSVINCLRTIVEGHNTNPTILPILRHRIVWLLGCSYNHLENRAFTLEVLVSILTDTSNPKNDLVVKLAAVEALTAMLYDPDDSLSSLLLSPDAIISSLYNLVNNCDEIEMQSQILSCISLILTTIIGSGNSLKTETAEAIILPLSPIWEETKNEKVLLRREILSILSGIATAIKKEHSGGLFPIALPLLNNVLDPSTREENLFLIETALTLWLTMLRLAPSYDSNLGLLFVRVTEILDQDLEHVKILTVITEGYLLLGGAAFLNDHATSLQHILSLLIGNISPRGVVYVNLILEALLRSPSSGRVELLVNCGVLSRILQACAENYKNSAGCEPDRVIIIYLTVMARILISFPSALDNLLPMNDREGIFFSHEHLLSLYFRFYEELSYDENGFLHQKVWTLFLLSLLPSAESPSTQFGTHILEEMDSLMSCCLQTVKDGSSTVVMPFSVGYDDGEETVIQGLDVYQALLMANSADDICHTDISSVLKLKMQQLAGCLDQDTHTRLLGSVRSNVLRELEQLLG